MADWYGDQVSGFDGNIDYFWVGWWASMMISTSAVMLQLMLCMFVGWI